MSTVLLATAVLPAGPAQAAVPAFPDNLVLFPDRDFMGLEGFERYAAGPTQGPVLIEVVRGGQVVGSTTGPVVVGDPALEVNHPGGVCWGNGTSLKVTPDMTAGDLVVLKVDGQPVADTRIADVHVTRGATLGDDGATVTVEGHIGSGVNRSQVEQRIVNPDLRDTPIGRRDVRATPGTTAQSGYFSTLEFNGETFTATYVFEDPAIARTVATGGGERIMAWLEEDADANRQGLTISEFGEVGGPGMGGCPAGPADQQSPAPGTAKATRSAAGDTAAVKWTPTQPQPGAAAITSFSVEAVALTNTVEQAVVGRRIGSGSATSTTLTGLDPGQDYRIEVRSIDTKGTSGAPIVATLVRAVAPDSGTNTAPVVVASPDSGPFSEPFSVTLSGQGPADDLYYTTDGTPATDADMPSEGSHIYTGPIAIGAQDTELHWAVFNNDGFYRTGSATYDYQSPAPPQPTAPEPPQNLDVSTDQAARTARASWTPPQDNGVPVTGYRVTLNGQEQPRTGTTTSQELTGLAYDTDYQVDVTALSETGESSAVTRTFRIAAPTPQPPSPPQSPQATAGHASARVTWGPSTGTDSPLDHYEVQALRVEDGTQVGSTVNVPPAGPLDVTVGGLTNGTSYVLRVTAVNGAGQRSSADSNAVTPSNVLTLAVAEFRTGKNELRVEGTSQAPGTRIKLVMTQRKSDGSTATTTLPDAVVQPDGTWAYRERNVPASRRPLPGATVTASSPDTAAAPVTANLTFRS